MKKYKRHFASFVIEIIGITGVLMLAYGLWLITPKAMFTVIGIIFISMSFLLHKGFNKTNYTKHGG